MGHRLDFTMMFAVHDALRRDLDRLARVTEHETDDPGRLLRTAAGWVLFKRHLHIHHTAEDVALWPVLERELAGREGDLALLAAMEAEHAVIDPLLTLVDAVLADREHGPQRLGGAVDALRSAVTAHLRHEERDTLDLIDAAARDEQWAAFGEEHRTRVGAGLPQYFPWVLDSGDPARVAAILSLMPPQIVAAYESEWRPAHEATAHWPGVA